MSMMTVEFLSAISYSIALMFIITALVLIREIDSSICSHIFRQFIHIVLIFGFITLSIAHAIMVSFWIIGISTKL